MLPQVLSLIQRTFTDTSRSRALGAYAAVLGGGAQPGRPVWGWVSLGLCAALFALFARYEKRLARRGGSPLISPRVLRAPGVPVAVFRIGCGLPSTRDSSSC